MTPSAARLLLQRRKVAIETNDQSTLREIDRKIANTVATNEWPPELTRYDSAPNYPINPNSRAPRRINWEA